LNTKPRNKARWQFILLIVILSVVVAGCSNVRNGVSWPALSTAIIGDETKIIVTYDSQAVALDPQNGDVLALRDDQDEIRRDADNNPLNWLIDGNNYEKAQFFANPFHSSADEGDTLIFPTYNLSLLEFYVDTLRPVNSAGIPLTDGVIADALVTDNFVYVSYRQQDVVALDRKTFEEVWRFDTLEGVWATPLLHEGVLYVPSINHLLHAVDAETGEALWPEPVDLEGAIASTPLYYNGFLYVGSYSHKMYKISLNGEIVAEHEGSNWIWSTPVVYDDVLYYADLRGSVYALNPNDLTEIWAVQPATRGIRPSPIVTEDYVVVVSRNGSLYWLARDNGSLIFEREMRGAPEILSEILWLKADETVGIDNDEDLIIVASTDSKNFVAAYRLDNSVEQWVYSR
jgi:outer membrane protein assembly factor BamB